MSSAYITKFNSRQHFTISLAHNIYTYGRNIDEICNRLNARLFRINEWLCSNGLTLNVDKSKYVASF